MSGVGIHAFQDKDDMIIFEKEASGLCLFY
jgi:hypothetical protein